MSARGVTGVLLWVALTGALATACDERRIGGGNDPNAPRPTPRPDAAPLATPGEDASAQDGDLDGGDPSMCAPSCLPHQQVDEACRCLPACEPGYAWDGRSCVGAMGGFDARPGDGDGGDADASRGDADADGGDADADGGDADADGGDADADGGDADADGGDADADGGDADADASLDAGLIGQDAIAGPELGPRDTGPPPMPGTLPLDAVCSANLDCASTVCADLGGSAGRRCTTSCGTTADCPSGFACADNTGARMCIAYARFTSGTFAAQNGASCTGGSDCRSGFCRANACAEVCADGADCGGASCAYVPAGNDTFVAGCGAPIGAAAPGATCAANADCASGLCANGHCSALCSSTADCSAAETCSVVNASVCLLELFGLCLQAQLNYVNACVASAHGSGAVGTPCTDASPCRSGLCHLTLSECTDTCARDSDCPGNYRCKVVSYGTTDTGETVWVNICAPLGF